MGRTYAIVGAGALGGFYGARLQQAGAEVHFLMRAHADLVRARGFVVESKDGDFTLTEVRAYESAATMPRCDVVVVALKATQNDVLPEILPHLVKEDGVVLVMQNGLGGEEACAAIVGKDLIMGGLCFLCSHKVGPGHIRHLDYGYVELGEWAADGAPRGVTDRMAAIRDDFERAGIRVEMSDDLLLSRWKKLVWNIPYNGLSVILHARTDQLMAHPAARELVESIMREVVADARACGKIIPESHIGRMLDNTRKMKPYATSMMLDYQNRQPMEIEAIFGNPLRAALRAGADSPRLEVLYRQLLYIDEQNRAE
jgi:2-dehydropantoate 2-reductase